MMKRMKTEHIFVQLVLLHIKPRIFENMCFKLNKVNYSFWFGAGLFETNNVEGLRGQIKRLSNNFSG